jgi:hypothetical protein
MRTEVFHAARLVELFRTRKIATMPELKAALGTKVDLTVFRKLQEVGYRTSYSHGGGYYTLQEIALFNDLGLWSFRAVRFSRYGTLVKTCGAFVTGSEAGYFAEELDDDHDFRSTAVGMAIPYGLYDPTVNCGPKATERMVSSFVGPGGQDFRKQLPDMGIEEVLSTPRSPWQRAYIERMIRRECLDQVIVFNEGSLRRILASYFDPERTYPGERLTRNAPGSTSRNRAGRGRSPSGWTAPSLRTASSLNVGSVLMIFSQPFRLHPLHLCSLVRRLPGFVRKLATRATSLSGFSRKTRRRATRNFR